jgi:hypothetical protein
MAEPARSAVARDQNAVSARFISRATLSIQPASAALGRMQTPAGLPANGLLVKASTWVIRRLMPPNLRHHVLMLDVEQL